MPQIFLDNNRTAYEPGEAITGQIRWQRDEVPHHGELRLCWNTRGKGTVDSDVAVTLPLNNLRPREPRPFTLRAPAEPYSFSGKLISLVWALELVVEPEEVERVELVIAPGAREIELPSAPEEPASPIKLGPVTLNPDNWKKRS